ncbi:MAG: hypothetical protein M3O31_16715 [Acidobacteriota bacterium]|nr:hypothetical protein [Acidobacteriota bacterium]
MPVKKAAKKAAKKMARKSPHNLPSQDLRRAYEHLGRVDILEGALAGVHFVQVSALATLAQQELASGHARDAAEMLRAAEHICFAALAPEDRPIAVPLVSADLKAAVSEELDRLRRRAEASWTDPDSDENQAHETIAAIYSAALEHAALAFSRGAYRPALELARAAEALSQIDMQFTARLSDRDQTRIAS